MLKYNNMKNEYKTLAIGTIFTYNGNRYKVCIDKGDVPCGCCAFRDINCDKIKSIRGNCCTRSDRLFVYFKLIKDNKNKR